MIFNDKEIISELKIIEAKLDQLVAMKKSEKINTAINKRKNKYECTLFDGLSEEESTWETLLAIFALSNNEQDIDIAENKDEKGGE